MQKDERFESKSPQPSIGEQQLAVITQLLRVAASIQHIDEMFLWVAHTFVQRLGIQVVEFWASQFTRAGQFSPTLRAIASQDTSLPQYIVANAQVAVLAERILREQRPQTLTFVSSIFSPHQANLLSRYSLNYCCGYFLSTQSLSDRTPPVLTVSTLLFLRHIPRQELLTSMGLILGQIIPAAKNRGLLPSA